MLDHALRWPALWPGDLVRLVSPSSTPSPEGVDAARGVLASWGLEVDVADHALDAWGYLAGRDHDRLADLNEAFRDPRVRAVVATRGGAGAYRISDGIDYEAVRSDPKPVVGFSDITHLHLALWRECRLPTVHGCLAGDQAAATARSLLVAGGPVLVRSDTGACSARVHRGGRATGRLVGGNLSTLCHMVGAGLPDLTGTILLLEDTREIGLGRVDRQLTQLRRAGALDGLAGVALGLFTGFDGYEDRGWDLADVLRGHLETLEVPVLGGLKIGHDGTGRDGEPDQVCVALGSPAVLDADAGTLLSESPALPT